MKINNPAIPFDSTVVVVGANGYIGVETCSKFLEAGFRVRGTVRDVERHDEWMHKTFDRKWPGKFELVCVPDFETNGAFDAAFNGAAAVIYVSTPIIFGPDVDNTIRCVQKGIINSLEAAAHAGIQRYVLSSSSKAVESTAYNVPHSINVNTFNNDAVHKMRAGAGDGFEKVLTNYSAVRTLAEQAFWTWLKENNPPFVGNCVVPDGNFGRTLNIESTNMGPSSSVGMLKRVLDGVWDNVIPHLAYFVDVQDTARLFVAAAVIPSVSGERIFSYCHNASWNELRHKLRTMYPDRPDLVKGNDLDLIGKDLSEASGPIARSEKLLRDMGQPGYASVENLLRDFINDFYA